MVRSTLSRKRPASSSDDEPETKRARKQRSSAIVAKSKITRSPTLTRNSDSNSPTKSKNLARPATKSPSQSPPKAKKSTPPTTPAQQPQANNKSPNAKSKIKSEKPTSDDSSFLERLVENSHRTSKFDLEMFKKAQAKAAEMLQENTKDVNVRHGIKCIELGRYEIDVWYSSPYPEEYRYLPKLTICESCLAYKRLLTSRHRTRCYRKPPPGNEIYRKGNLSLFEVDGQHKGYCQRLCLLAKLFLNHKTLYYDVEPFLFYVMAEYDDDGFHIVGYFSKEKKSILNYNLSCILILPPYQKKGYGKMLIHFSYLLGEGTPERPLSDVGLISYRSYWKSLIIGYLINYKSRELSIKQLATDLKIMPSDAVATMQAIGILRYWRGKHIILMRQDILDDYKINMRKRGFQRIDESKLIR